MKEEHIERRFGIVAFYKGFITAEELVEALRIQVMEELNGMGHRVLGEILYEQGFMKSEQINEVIEAMTIPKV